MRILLVNNHTQHLPALTSALSDHELEVISYRPGVSFNQEGKDLIILSGGGGEGREANDVFRNGKLWYQDELDFILKSKVPILGICMGFELIAQAHGASIKRLPTLISGFKPVVPVTRKAVIRPLKQFESHNYAIHSVSSKHFEVLAQSDTGIEVIRHKTRRILATQFHPEISGSSLNLSQLAKRV